jgi:hypothetical protein
MAAHTMPTTSPQYPADRRVSPRKQKRFESRDAAMEEERVASQASVIEDWTRLDSLDALAVLQHILAAYLEYLSASTHLTESQAHSTDPTPLSPAHFLAGPMDDHLRSIQQDVSARMLQPRGQSLLHQQWNRQTIRGQPTCKPTLSDAAPWQFKGSADQRGVGPQAGRYHHGTLLGHHSSELTDSPGEFDGQLTKGSSANTLGDGPFIVKASGLPRWHRGKECSANSMGDGPHFPPPHLVAEEKTNQYAKSPT